MNEDILIVCESIFNSNTMKLAASMAKRLNCRLVNSSEAMLIDLAKYKIIGLGSGIYFTSHHPKILNIALKIKNPNQKVFIFSTHGRPFLGKYHNKLKECLSKNSIEVIGEFSARGYDCTGPYIIVSGGNKGKPNEYDQKKAEKFVAKLLPQYAIGDSSLHSKHHVEIDYSRCIGCGKCKTNCPLQVFGSVDQKITVQNENECIHCSLCKDNCPVQAISLHHSWMEAIKIAKHQANRKSL